MEYVYGQLPVDPTTSTVVRNTTGQLFAVDDVGFTNPLAFRDLTGVQQTVLRVGPLGVTDEFRIDGYPEVLWKSGDFVVHLWSPRAVLDAAVSAAADAASSDAAAQEALATIRTIIAEQGGLPSAGGGAGGGGNAYVIWGALTPRRNPADGGPLPAEARVIWIADTQPVNMVPGEVDFWANQPGTI